MGLSSRWSILYKIQSTYSAKLNSLRHPLRLFLPSEQLCLREKCVLLKLKSASGNLSAFALVLFFRFSPLPSLPLVSLLLIIRFAAVSLHDSSTFLTLLFSLSSTLSLLLTPWRWTHSRLSVRWVVPLFPVSRLCLLSLCLRYILISHPTRPQ